MVSLVFNIRPATASDVRNLSAHELQRAPDGNSAIDPARSHLNRVLIGPRTQSEALDALFASGVQRPAAQSEAPYVQIVLGASAEFFRPDDPEAAGTFQAERVEQFEREATAWLKATFGDDLIHAATHLDETTPHMHVLVAPTYQKAARKPGRKKRGETDAEFEARKRKAAERPTVRTVGRRSNALLSAPNSFQHLRQSLADHLAPLGIAYGDDLHPTDPDPQTTRQKLKSENDFLRAWNAYEQEQAEEAEERAAEAHRAVERATERQEALRALEEALAAREAAVVHREASLARQAEETQTRVAEVRRAAERVTEQQQALRAKEEAQAAHEATVAHREADLEGQAQWLERAAVNLQIAMRLAVRGEHDQEITASDMPDDPAKFETLRRSAPDGRPTSGWRCRFWSLFYSNSGEPVAEHHLPVKIRDALSKAFDRVAAWAGEIAERAAEVHRATEKLTERQQALQAQEEALATREGAMAHREAVLAKQAQWLERGAGNLQVAMRMAVSGEHDREITASDMADDPQRFETLCSSAPDGRPTWGWRSRFWSLFYSDSGEPAPEQHLPVKIRDALSKAFERVAAWAGEIAEQAEKLAIRERKVAQAEEAADGLLLEARRDAQNIVRQAHRDAESYAYLAETLETIRQAPQPLQQLALNYEAFQEVTQTALRRLGVAEKRIDLFGDYQDADPPPVLELVVDMAQRRAKEKTNALVARLGSALRPGM